jgi:hypothetical protein
MAATKFKLHMLDEDIVQLLRSAVVSQEMVITLKEKLEEAGIMTRDQMRELHELGMARAESYMRSCGLRSDDETAE